MPPAAAGDPPSFTSAAEPAHGLAELSLDQLIDIPIYAAARRDQKSSEAASSVTIITSAEIANHGWRTLAEIASAIPGFYVTDDRSYRCLGVRGFGRPGDYGSRILFLLNGVRVNEPMYDQGGVGLDAIVDVAIIDRVEVVRGPSSSLYGTNALLAVVNIITRTGADAAGGQAAAAYASYGTWHGSCPTVDGPPADWTSSWPPRRRSRGRTSTSPNSTRPRPTTALPRAPTRRNKETSSPGCPGARDLSAGRRGPCQGQPDRVLRHHLQRPQFPGCGSPDPEQPCVGDGNFRGFRPASDADPSAFCVRRPLHVRRLRGAGRQLRGS